MDGRIVKVVDFWHKPSTTDMEYCPRYLF